MGLAAAILDQLDHVGDWGLLATDAALVVTRWNRWLEERSGFAAADVVGRPLLEIFPDLVTRRLDRYYRQALTGQTVLLSQRFHKYVIPLPPAADRSGHAYLQQTSRIVPLVDGPDVCGTLTLIEDVTERVAYEAELQTRARQQAVVAGVARAALGGRDMADLAREVVGHLRGALDVDAVEVLELAPDGGVWSVLAADGWHEPRATEFAAGTAARTRHVLGADSAVVGLARADAAADPHLDSNGVAGGLVARVPGHERPFGVLGAYTRYPRQFSTGEVLFTQALADVLGVAAERKRLEGELRLRVGELAETGRRKDEFLAMLAHELRNPLAPIQNAVETLHMRTGGDPVADRMNELLTRQVGQMVRLIDDLLDVSRITTGKITLRRERVALADLMGRAVESARPLLDARRHDLVTALPPDPIFLDADPTRLVQVLGNLLNNAAKYTEEGGRVGLAARREGGEAVVSVTDTGTGISAEMLPQVFDLFTQVDCTLDRSQGGLGIGLTLVRRLVELHGGTVRAFSAGPGRGSEFVVRLPVAPEPAPRTGGVVPRATPAASAVPQHILIVDDNVDSADSLATVLGLKGHRTWTAYDGPAALDAARAHRPGFVLLDIGLPRMDGYEVARRLRQAPDLRGAVLVAMTGYGQDEDRRKGQEAGFDYHLVKPVDLTELAKILAQGRKAPGTR
jgi:PAS domain S-box-containing protein